MNQSELDAVVAAHDQWLWSVPTGKQADLSGQDLSGLSLKGVNLSGVDLSNATLMGTNFWGAWLEGANLEGANLLGTIGNNREIRTLQTGSYVITYTHDRLQIGCENHDIEAWWKFTTPQILSMDGEKAAKFWRQWRNPLLQIIDQNPATKPGDLL